MWLVMSMAMMIPVAMPALRHVAMNSMRHRRHRAMTIFGVAYLGIWLAAGLVVMSAAAILTGRGVDWQQLVVGAFAAATAWQLTPWKRRAVGSCQRVVPLPPTGLRADAACAHFGLQHARRCVVSCAPYMGVMAVVGHLNLLLMGAMSIAVAMEKFSRVRRQLVKPFAGALALVTVGFGLILAG